MKTIKDLTSIAAPNDAAEIWVQDQAATGVDRRWSLANIATWVISKLGTSATKNMASGVSTFGTASGSNVTTSVADTTNGRVLKVGDFGLGGESIPPSSLVDADNPALKDGFYRFEAAAGSLGTRPSVGGNVWHWIHLQRNSGLRANQLWFSQEGDFVYSRSWNGTAWNTYSQLLSTSYYPSDTAWTTTTTLLNGWTGTVRYIKRAGMVTVVIEQLNNTSASSTNIVILPATYRPGVNMRFLVNDSDTSNLRAIVGTDGTLVVVSVGTSSDIRGTVTYPVIT